MKSQRRVQSRAVQSRAVQSRAVQSRVINYYLQQGKFLRNLCTHNSVLVSSYSQIHPNRSARVASFPCIPFSHSAGFWGIFTRVPSRVTLLPPKPKPNGQDQGVSSLTNIGTANLCCLVFINCTCITYSMDCTCWTRFVRLRFVQGAELAVACRPPALRAVASRTSACSAVAPGCTAFCGWCNLYGATVQQSRWQL